MASSRAMARIEIPAGPPPVSCRMAAALRSVTVSCLRRSRRLSAAGDVGEVAGIEEALAPPIVS